MKKFDKILFTVLFAVFATFSSFAQHGNLWTPVTESGIGKNIFAKFTKPKAYKLFQLNDNGFKSLVNQAPSERNTNVGNSTTIVSFPNAAGELKSFRIVDAPIMEAGLAAKYPGINAYAGSATDKSGETVRFSVSPMGISAMILSIDKPTVYIDPIDITSNSYIVVSKNELVKTGEPFICSTPQMDMIGRPSSTTSNLGADDGKLRTFRLALVASGEYSQFYLNGTEPDDATRRGKVLIAMNRQMVRVNAIYERDFGVRMILVANNDLVIYLNPTTDPFNNSQSNWNTQTQIACDNLIGSANYDIGHLVNAQSGGGNAGCIGCVCTAGSKGSGFTGYTDLASEEYFIVDYLTHEMGHQFGGNHTFDYQNEGTIAQQEPGSGSTIMGYAGITNVDVQPHSDDLFHSVTIQQVTNNIKTGVSSACAVVIVTGNTAPTANAGANYTIPKSTPFTLTGSGSDADAGDVLSYTWEQKDVRATGFSIVPSATATAGPQFRAYNTVTTPSRTFPVLASILNGSNTNAWEVLPSVARVLNFRFTVRDNHAGGGNNQNGDMAVTVSATSGPFTVTSPNTNVSWAGGSTQTITWDVNNTTAAPVSAANVKIFLSTDGGLTFPTILAASTLNDGSEVLTIPSTPSTTARIKIQGDGNIFFDISNTNFTITAPATGYTFNSFAPATITCGQATSGSITLGTTAQGGFSTPINLTASGNPAGTTVSFGTNPIAPGSSSVVTLNNTNTLAPGTYNVTVTGVAGTVTQNSTLSYIVQPGTAPSITTQPAAVTLCAGGNATFSVVSPGAGLTYQWQVSSGGPFTNIVGATGTSYTVNAVTAAENNNQYQVIVSALCGTTTTNAAVLTVNTAPAINTQPADATICAGNNNTFTVAAAGTGLTYQWQVSTDGGVSYNNIAGANSSTYTLNAVTVAFDNNRYRVIINGTCPSAVTSNGAILSVSSSVNITSQPSALAACSGSNADFTVTASGSGVNYQWQVSTNGGVSYTNIAGATSATLTLTGVTTAINGNLYQAVLTNATCTVPSTSSAALLTVNSLPAITTQPTGVTLCAGSNTTFTAAATGTAIGYQWQISTNGGTTFTDITGATAATYTLNAIDAALNNNQYHVVVSGTCAPAATSNAAVLTVISPATISAQPVDDTKCAGSNASFTVSGNAGGAPAIIYQWQVSNAGGPFTNITGATAATLNLTAVTAGMNNNQYQVLLSNATCTAQAVSNPVTLTVNDLPTVSATADAISVCTGTPVNLTASGAETYTWTPGTALSGTTVTVTPTVNPSTPAIANPIVYTATGTDLNGCVNTGTITVTANPLPAVTLTADPTNTKIIPGQTVVLTATVVPAGGFTFTWRKNGVVIPNYSANTLTATVNDLGEYTVTAADPTGLCVNQSNLIKVSDSATTRFYVYPNPNDGRFIISYHNPGGIPTNRTVGVYDSRGARVYSKALAVTQQYQLIKVDLRPVATGIYYAVLYDAAGNRLATEKIIVH